MTTVTTSTAAATTAKSATDANRATIAQNFDAFLLLLTTQLKNQSPLDPLDTNQFTQQLVQFASVEQQLRSNDTLNSLLTSVRASNTASAADYVGMQITADGATVRLPAGGKGTWTLNAARDVMQATITIIDRNGAVVATKTQPIKAGGESFVWDGKTSSGADAPEGDYTIAVTGRDAAGQAVAIKTEISGRVDSVDISGDSPVLLVGGVRLPIERVKSIGRAAS